MCFCGGRGRALQMEVDGKGGIPRLLECVTECMRSPLSESKDIVGEERIQIHSGQSQLEMALALHVELPGALRY